MAEHDARGSGSLGDSCVELARLYSWQKVAGWPQVHINAAHLPLIKTIHDCNGVVYRELRTIPTRFFSCKLVKQ